MKRAFLHFVCALLLVSSQLTALTHSVWHLRDSLPAHGQHESAALYDRGSGDTPSPQAELCAFHAALSSLFGGGCVGQLTFAPAGLSDWPAISIADRHVARSALTPPSRAPPVLL
jgi:hypothetical protein